MDEHYSGEYEDALVCAECIEDDDLREFIKASAVDDDGEVCTFCRERGDAVAVCRFHDLMEHVESCITEYYDLAANNLGWIGSEGGWQGNYWDTYDLLTERIGLGLPNDADGSLREAICSYLGLSDWCTRNPYGESPLESLTFDWDRFTQVVKYETRFFLTRYEKHGSSIHDDGRSLPEDALKAIGSAATRMELFTRLPAGTLLYRVRYQEGGPLTTPGELGPPPCERAFVSNRMSPPGIVMFYAAFDRDTAMAETCTNPGDYSIGTFQTVVELDVLDLTRIPDAPGVFAVIPDSREWSRHDALFFQSLVSDLTARIARDERVHLEYIPTQVVVEYFRRRFHRDFDTEHHKRAPLQGVLYPSARKPGHKALVLFCDRAGVKDAKDDNDESFYAAGGDQAEWLELIAAASTSLDVHAIAGLGGVP